MKRFQLGQLKWLYLSFIIIGLDQLSKYIAVNNLNPYEPVPFFRGFNWMLAYNRGAAFSFLDSAGGWQQWVFNGIAFIVSLVLIRWMAMMKTQEKWLAIACSFIIGGAIGNVIDRLIQAKVTDFIDWYYGQYHWPTFNIADSFIFLGAALFIFDTWIHPQQPQDNKIDEVNDEKIG